MTSQDGGLIHELILAGSAILAPKVGKIEAGRLGAILENGLLNSLHTAEERETYYRGCDDRLDAILCDRPGHKRELLLEQLR
jgi:hypothetical protein